MTSRIERYLLQIYFVWEFDVSYEYIREIPDFNALTLYNAGFGYLDFDFNFALRKIWRFDFEFPEYLAPFWAFLDKISCPGFLEYTIKKFFSSGDFYEPDLDEFSFGARFYNALLSSELEIDIKWMPFFINNIFSDEFITATQCMFYVYSRKVLLMKYNYEF